MTSSMLSYIQRHAQHQPGKIAFRYHDAKGGLDQLTFLQLSERTRMAASVLRANVALGGRVGILLTNSIEYIVSVFAAQAAGLVPVPLMEPSKGAGARSRRLEDVLGDCQASAVIVNDASLDTGSLVRLSTAQLLAPAAVLDWEDIHPQEVAFLQYTSGSTTHPKGVIVTHANLVSNSLQLSAGLGTHADTVFGSWLPLFHDMGLVGKVMHPLQLGASSHLIRPETFMRHPRRWLEMISNERVSISAAPNFAYERCCDVVTDRAELDLSCWTLALNGSEPVRAQTLVRFAESFAECGFQHYYFQPVYGMAEATLFVTSRGVGNPIRTTTSREGNDAPAGARTLVSVGRAWRDAAIVVWNTRERREAVEGETGEILIAGSNCSTGYFGRPELSTVTFGVQVPGSPLQYVQTEDLGFMHDGELYITGRSKEIIMLRGRNHYPQDVESAAQSADARLVRDGGAAVQLESAHGSAVVLVQELVPGTSEIAAQLCADAVAAVMEATGVRLDAVIPIRRGQLPKTTSGKIARAQVRMLLKEGRFPGFSLDMVHARQRLGDMLEWWRQNAPRWDGRLADERRSIAPHVILQMGRRGVMGLNQPLAIGGAELGVAGMMRMVREASATELTLAAFVGVHNGLVVEPIARFGSPEQQARWLPDLASGRSLGCFALTERNGGSNPRAIKARAVLRGETWHLEGRKTWIGTAAWSDVAVFFAYAYLADGQALGMTAFLVPTNAPGVMLGPETLTLGVRGMVQSDLDLVDVQLDAGHVLGRPGQGFEIAQQTMTLGRLGVANMALGSLQGNLKIWHAYAAERVIASGRLLDHPVTQARLFQAHAEAAGVGWWCDTIATQIERQQHVPVEVVSLLKVAASETSWNGVDKLLQAMGGRGYDESNQVAQRWRDSRLLRIFEGASEALQSYAGHALASGQEATRLYLGEQISEPLILSFNAAVAALMDACHEAGLAPAAMHATVGHAACLWLLQSGLRAAWPDDADRQHAEATLEAKWRGVLDQAIREAVWLPSAAPSMERLVAMPGAVPWVPQPMRIALAPSLAQSIVATVSVPAPVPVSAESPLGTTANVSRGDIAAWLSQWIAHHSPTVPPMRTDRTFTELGLDSVDAVDMIDALIQRYGMALEPGLLWEFPTIDRLSAYLATRSTPPRPVIAAAVEGDKDDDEDIIRALERELD
ncbi:AMP-binding protein [Xanthomonas axonopodis]